MTDNVTNFLASGIEIKGTIEASGGRASRNPEGVESICQFKTCNFV